MSTFLTTGALKQDIVEITASSTTPLALTSLSPTIYYIVGTDTQEITFPDAQSLEVGIHYVIINNSTKPVTVNDYDASALSSLNPGISITFYLSDNSTSAGVWALGIGGAGGGSLTAVRAVDFTTTVLPTTPSVVIDGVTLADDDKILFGNVALNGVYQVSGIGVAASWTKLTVFNGSDVPSEHDTILVREGSELNATIWLSDSALTPPWHRVAGPASTVWTGDTPDANTTWDGTLRPEDTNVKLALDTIDKYFRGLQLRRHATDPNRVTILASSTTKTDMTVLNFTIADRLMSFAGAEIDFETGTIYASDGMTSIGSFSPQAIPEDEFYWYGIGLDAPASESDNTIEPQITIEYSTDSNLVLDDAPKPSLTSRYTLGAVLVRGDTGGVGITPITQGSIVYIGQFTGYTDLEDTVAQNTIDITTLQSYVASVPIIETFPVGAGGQSVFDLTLFTVDASNAIFDVDYLIDGRWQLPSITGDFLDGGAVRKNSTTQVETAEPVPEGKTFVVIKRTMSGGSPLVDLTGITVDLGFITPKTVGTLERPAWSFILKDKVTADIWEVEVRNGVFQVVKIGTTPPEVGEEVPAEGELVIPAGTEYIIPAT